MGVKGFLALLQANAPQAVHFRRPSHYRGKTLAIDISCFFNRYIYGLDPHPARVQQGIYKLCIYLEQYDIRPIFVFDGPGRIAEKYREGQRRAALKEKVKKAFGLEHERKSRLKGLQGSAKLMKEATPEQIEYILSSIELQDTPTASSTIPSKEDTKTGTALDTLLVDDEELVSDREGFMHDPEVQLGGGGDDAVVVGNVGQESAFGVQASTTASIEESDSRETLLESEIQAFADAISPQQISETTTEWPIPVTAVDYGIAQMSSTEITSEENIVKDESQELPVPVNLFMRQQVHSALQDFVDRIESSNSNNDNEFDSRATPRQRELGQLEIQLVQQVKEASRLYKASVVEFGPTHESSTQTAAPTPLANIDVVDVADIAHADDAVHASYVADIASVADVSQIAQVTDITASSILEKVILVDDILASEIRPVGAEASELLTDREVDRVLEGESSESVFLGDSAEVLGDPALSTIHDTQQGDTDDHIPADSQSVKSTINQIVQTHQTLFSSLGRRTLKITSSMTKSCRNLLEAMGKPCITSHEAEAEAVCARLTTLGFADGTASEDSDTCVFGKGLLLRQFFSRKDIIEVDPVVAHQGLGLNRDAFRDLCILCGTDFSDTIEGIGPKKALKLMRYYGSIESIMANTPNKPREYFLYDHARRVFDSTPVVPLDPIAYQQKPVDQEKLTEMLKKFDIDPEEVRASMEADRLKEEMESAIAAASPSSFAAGTDKDSNVDPFIQFAGFAGAGFPDGSGSESGSDANSRPFL